MVYMPPIDIVTNELTMGARYEFVIRDLLRKLDALEGRLSLKEYFNEDGSKTETTTPFRKLTFVDPTSEEANTSLTDEPFVVTNFVMYMDNGVSKAKKIDKGGLEIGNSKPGKYSVSRGPYMTQPAPPNVGGRLR